jgi:hypothetical protein
MPFGNQIHYQIQRNVTKEWPRRQETLDDLLVAARQLFLDISTKIDVSSSSFVEIGAGRDLAVAVALRLMGVKKITCVDITFLAKPSLIYHAAQYMANKLGKPCPVIKNWNDVESFGISYAAPASLESLNLSEKSFDCFYSVDTLEHIPFEALRGIFAESSRILKSNGISIHFIDYGDHYLRGSNISRFNFLTFTYNEWKPFNSKFQYVNRMRHSEYLNLFRCMGFSVVDEVPVIEAPETLIIDRLAPEFKEFTIDDLFTIRSKIVALSPRLK